MYLLNARTLLQMAESLQADEKTRSRIRFAVQQWIDAASPSNFLALNPEAQRKAIETQGESMAEGLRTSGTTCSRAISRRPTRACSRSAATSPRPKAAVVFENELFQLLEYKPLTRQGVRAAAADRAALHQQVLHPRPAAGELADPPCGRARAPGLRRQLENAGEEIAQRTWDDYIEDAAIKAIGLVQEIAGSEQINTLGFCVGGTILATALAVLAARGERPAASMTLLTTLLDFSDTGVLDIFIDEASVQMREMTIGAESAGGGSLLKGQELATTFSFLRPNDLVWNYVVGNYLKGETPPPFDLLYWNSDGTNLPGPMYCWYLRNTYLENKLKEPGELTVCGEKVDLGTIEAPAYIYASREDHIVPWEGAYRSTAHPQGQAALRARRVGSHRRRDQSAAEEEAQPLDRQDRRPAGQCRRLARRRPRSTPAAGGPTGATGCRPHAGKQVAAPKAPGNRKYKAIEPAPGRYVKEKA